MPMCELMARRALLGMVALLVLRGVLLWLLVPVAACIWLLLARPLRRHGVGLGAFLGWFDLNLVACLQRSVCRPFLEARSPWVHPRDLPHITHRVRIIDPA